MSSALAPNDEGRQVARTAQGALDRWQSHTVRGFFESQ
jgi:hypothetical protein